MPCYNSAPNGWTIFTAIASVVAAIGTCVAGYFAGWVAYYVNKPHLRIIMGIGYEDPETPTLERKYLIILSNTGIRPLTVVTLAWRISTSKKKKINIQERGWLLDYPTTESRQLTDGQTMNIFIDNQHIEEIVKHIHRTSTEYLNPSLLRDMKLTAQVSTEAIFSVRIAPEFAEALILKSKSLFPELMF
jgi:hypothetical protein